MITVLWYDDILLYNNILLYCDNLLYGDVFIHLAIQWHDDLFIYSTISSGTEIILKDVGGYGPTCNLNFVTGFGLKFDGRNEITNNSNYGSWHYIFSSNFWSV